MDDERFLNTKEASAFLKNEFGLDLSEATLATMRCRGGGPAYRKWGRIPVYTPPNLRKFARERLGALHSSTSVVVEEVRDAP